VKRGTLSQARKRELKDRFDLVVANITSNIISALAESFYTVVKPGGRLAVSGISTRGIDEVLIKLTLAGFKLESVDSENDWYVVVAKK